MSQSKNRTVTVAALQNSFGENLAKNIETVTGHIKEAAAKGAQIILPPELFESPYFCKVEEDQFFSLAKPFEGHPTIKHFQTLARELKVVIPLSFFEKDGPHYFNSLAMIDADGTCLGVYRKSHIPDGPGYEEKFYFKPGNTGFKVWDTKYAKVGVGICWDQWFPETARAMMLMGAEILFYPTAIGSEPNDPSLETSKIWQRAMIGHAVSNVVPVIAANRIGDEEGQVFYGHSFISDHRGEVIAELGADETGVITGKFDLDQVQKNRASFGFFRDRRPELYGVLSTP